MGMILRNFVIKDIDFYTRVFDAVVITGLTYASEVWRPYRKKGHKKNSKFNKEILPSCMLSVWG